MRVLGVDPGTQVTGYGIVDGTSRSAVVLEYGCIRTSSNASLARRLARIYDSLAGIIQGKNIGVMSIEEAFYAKNVKTTLILGHARGALLLAAEKAGLQIVEYSAREVKLSVTGSGASSKEQVQYMVKRLLNIKEKIEPLDATDALAVALCHVNRSSYNEKLKKAAALAA